MRQAIVEFEASIALRACQLDPGCRYLDRDWLQRYATARTNLLRAVAGLVGSESEGPTR